MALGTVYQQSTTYPAIRYRTNNAVTECLERRPGPVEFGNKLIVSYFPAQFASQENCSVGLTEEDNSSKGDESSLRLLVRPDNSTYRLLSAP